MVLRTGNDSQIFPEDITAATAWNMLQSQDNIALIDVRTRHETHSEGQADISKSGQIYGHIEWRCLPDMHCNAHFFDQLNDIISDPSTTIIFLCKAGIRSTDAGIKAIENGYNNCYNLLGGIESWQQEHLPWTYPDGASNQEAAL